MFDYNDSFRLKEGEQPNKNKSKEEFVSKKLSGLYKKIDPSGKIRQEGRFQNGIEVGLWKVYDQDGDEVHYQFSYQRVGAICGDGSRSTATGRGACSWHGGVAEWLYQNQKRRVGGTGKYVPIQTRIADLKVKIKKKLPTNKTGLEFDQFILKKTLSLFTQYEDLEVEFQTTSQELSQNKQQLKNCKTKLCESEAEIERLRKKLQDLTTDSLDREEKVENKEKKKYVQVEKEKQKKSDEKDKKEVEKSNVPVKIQENQDSIESHQGQTRQKKLLFHQQSEKKIEESEHIESDLSSDWESDEEEQEEESKLEKIHKEAQNIKLTTEKEKEEEKSEENDTSVLVRELLQKLKIV